MKIAMYNVTTTVRFGGVETFICEVSKELAKRGYDVHIIGGYGNQRLELPGVKILTFPFRSRLRFPNFGTRFRKFAERISFALNAGSSLEKYDLFIIFKPYDVPVALWHKQQTGCRIILTGHGTDFFPGDRWFVGKVDGMTACSMFNASRMEARYQIPAEIIYNGVDTTVFKPQQPDAPLRKDLGLNDNDKVIVYSGRLVGWKGVRFLLDAFSKVRITHATAKLLIIGDGPERERLGQQAIELGLGGSVIFVGYVPHSELPRYYSLAYAAVQPSVGQEDFGITIAEAMACGIPVVATNVGGIPEVADARLLVQPGHSDEIVAKLVFLIEDKDRCQQLGEDGRGKIRELFTWIAVTDRLLGYCNRITSAA